MDYFKFSFFLFLLGLTIATESTSELELLPYSTQERDLSHAANETGCVKPNSSSCPLWTFCNLTSSICQCFSTGNANFMCDGIYRPKLLECKCITYHRGSIEIGSCLYNCFPTQRFRHVVDSYYLLPENISDWNRELCGRFNRVGKLCGKCSNGSYPRAYSFDMSCIECHNLRYEWLLYIMTAVLPLTVFYITILLLHINVHSSHLQGFALYSQLVSTPIFARNMYLYAQKKPFFLIPLQFFGSLYGVWNLDFFRMFNPKICLQLDTLSTLALDLALAVYPLLLMAITYTLIHLYDRKIRVFVVLWRPFRIFFAVFKRNWDIRTSTVDSFATFLFLSNVKCLSVCCDLLMPVVLDKYTILNGYVKHEIHWKLYYDPTIPYFGDEHVHYAYLAFLVALFFVVVPIFVLIFYPFSVCQKCLNILPRRLILSLHTFVDSFQGCYKDGMKTGTRDLRWFSAFPFVIRVIVFSIYAITLNEFSFPLLSMVLVLSAIAVIVLEPFKIELSHFSNQLVIFILCLVSFILCIMGGTLFLTFVSVRTSNIVIFSFLLSVVAVVPLLYISVLIVAWLIRHRKFGFEIVKRIQARGFRYSLE